MNQDSTSIAFGAVVSAGLVGMVVQTVVLALVGAVVGAVASFFLNKLLKKWFPDA